MQRYHGLRHRQEVVPPVAHVVEPFFSRVAVARRRETEQFFGGDVPLLGDADRTQEGLCVIAKAEVSCNRLVGHRRNSEYAAARAGSEKRYAARTRTSCSECLSSRRRIYRGLPTDVNSFDVADVVAECAAVPVGVGVRVVVGAVAAGRMPGIAIDVRAQAVAVAREESVFECEGWADETTHAGVEDSLAGNRCGAMHIATARLHFAAD